MDDLIKFLQARLDEDWAAAEELWLPEELMGTVADTKRVLADVDAKRQIIDRCQNSNETMPSWGSEDYPGGERSGLYQAVQLLAQPYAEHPDYRQEWKP